MLIDPKANPFGAAKTPQEPNAPVGIMQIDAPQAAPMTREPGMVEQGVGILKNKATDMAVNKATGAATTAIEGAVAGAGKGGAATGAAAGATGAAGTGLMAAAAPMAAPLMIGGLIASKLFK